MFRRIAINTASSFGFRFFSLGLSFASVPVLVQAAGAEGYGVILLAQAVLGYFSVLNAGVPAGTVKYVAQFEALGDHRGVSQIIASSFTFFMGAGALAAVAVGTFTALGGLSLFNIGADRMASATRLLYVAAGLSLVNWPLSTFGQALEGLQRYPENKLAVGLGDVVNKGGAITAALAGASIEVIFLCMSVGALLSVPLQLRALRRALPGWRLRLTDFRIGTLRMIFDYSVWAMFGRLSVLLIYQTDRVLLGLFLPVASLTIYQVVTMPFLAIAELSSLYRSAITPAVSAAEARGGRGGIEAFIYSFSRYSNAFVAPVAIIGAFLAGPFIVLWMGGEYLQYVWIAQVACVFQLWWQSNSALGTVFYGSGKIRQITLIALAMAVLNVPLGIWWVQSLGVAGVVFSTIAVGIAGVPLQYLLAMPELEMDRGRYFWKSVVKGQWPSWVMGLALLPGWGYLQEISSWASLTAHAFGMATVFYGVAWFLSVEKRHRDLVYSLLPTR